MCCRKKKFFKTLSYSRNSRSAFNSSVDIITSLWIITNNYIITCCVKITTTWYAILYDADYIDEIKGRLWYYDVTPSLDVQ